MSPYNPGANPGATPGTASVGSNDSADTQTVIGLLGSLMPLLLQIQMQSGQQLFQRGSWQQSPFATQPGFAQSAMGPFAGPFAGPLATSGPDQAGFNGPFGGPFGDFAAANPLLDQQAAVAFVEDITADTLRTLSGYLETYANQHQALQSCVPIITQAARAFAARDYAQTFGLIWQAYRVITALRAGNPQLPPPRAAGIAGTSFSTSTHVH
jgi:hypothetical protein